MGKRPYELKRYIAVQQENRRSYDYTNYIMTRDAVLDGIATEAEKQYAAGLEVIKSIPEDDLERCRELYMLNNRGRTHGMNDLSYERVGGKWVLVPNFVALIDKVQKLKKAPA